MSCRIYMDHAATTEMLPEVREPRGGGYGYDDPFS